VIGATVDDNDVCLECRLQEAQDFNEALLQALEDSKMILRAVIEEMPDASVSTLAADYLAALDSYSLDEAWNSARMFEASSLSRTGHNGR
jgi:hypothetical protein